MEIKMCRKSVLVIFAFQWLSQFNVGASKFSFQVQTSSIQSVRKSILLRGGTLSPSSSSKKKKAKKSKKISKQETGPTKNVIADAMEKDPTEALGDAIRDRAKILQGDDPLLQSIGWSISSVGQALGASDHRMSEGGGVEAATTSIIANYFLKSHGGVHGLQFLCSFLATVSGLGVLLLRGSPQGLVMLKRTMIFAMIKHVSGVLAAAIIAGRAIPKIGLSNARQWMEKLVLDPVSQYVFFTALVSVWLPSPTELDSCWWWKKFPLVFLLVGPILIREVISIALVVSDVLVLSSVSGDSALVEGFLTVTNSAVDVVMNMLVSAKSWRNADPSKRQTILANLVSQASMGMEVGVGLLMFADTIYSLSRFVFTSGSMRPSFRRILSKLLCIRLYVHFLWVRRKKISKLVTNVRGGALKLPFWFLDILENPGRSMGLVDEVVKTETEPSLRSWQDYATTALAFNS